MLHRDGYPVASLQDWVMLQVRFVLVKRLLSAEFNPLYAWRLKYPPLCSVVVALNVPLDITMVFHDRFAKVFSGTQYNGCTKIYLVVEFQ
jgi:hypothetical protein